ncbi:hypothetical protein [Alkalibacillus salilacus]|uniref:YfhD-like protein n=1 Tax=Alkalibacillus salilacus TaxID=284582 RepID=A0ABT9VG32_9BACI|nr:hypothetical protein [Alkalibacillus salilacus]MDQ0159914.1 hypothetical protein [Alkalibacillus salilacus]
MASKNNREKDPRSEFDLDVERMLNEGLAGGQFNPKDGQGQIEQSHDIRRNNKPFAKADDDES